MKSKYKFLDKGTPSFIEYRNYTFSIVIALLLILIQTGCKKLVEINPPITSTSGANVYDKDATATAVLTGIYTNLSNGYFSYGGVTSLSLFPGLSSDELSLYGGTDISYIAYYTNALSSSNTGGSDFWNNIYPYIFTCNSAIEGITKSATLSQAVKQQLLGEAKFMRAFFYFYLTNLYGDVPLAINTGYRENASLPRASKTLVWQQIIADLKDAQTLLSNGYVDASVIKSTTERVRPNKWAATALLARAYLYTGDWANAEAQASAVISNSSLYNLSTLDNVFLKNSSEAIWQLQPVSTGYNTYDADVFILLFGPNSFYNSFWISPQLQSAFETGDNRFTKWIGIDSSTGTYYYYPYKYKIPYGANSVSEYLMVLRLGEQYLIRSEARAQQGNISGAKSDLNAIRTRAGLLNTTASTQSSLLTAIQHERQVELFTEWGHRWFDLKRTGKVDAVMSVVTPQKGGTWNTNWQWYPIPIYEIQTNHSLIQNSGY